MRFGFMLTLRLTRRNAGSFVPVLAFMAFGCSIAFILLSGFFSFRLKYSEVLANERLGDIHVKILTSSENFGSRGGPALTLDDIRAIENDYGDDFTLKAAFSHLSGNRDGTGMKSVFFLTEGYMEYFRRILGVTEGEPFAAASITAMEKWATQEGNSVFTSIDLERGFVSITGVDGMIPVMSMESFDGFDFYRLEPVVWYDSDEMSFAEYLEENAVFLPIELYYAALPTATLSLHINPVKNLDSVYDAVMRLSIAHNGQYSFSLDSVVEELLLEIREYVEAFQIGGAALVLLLIIVTVSFLGLQLILLDKQKRGIAIEMVCGASRQSVSICELVRSCAVTLIGGLVGSAAGAALIGFSSFYIGNTIIKSSIEAFLLTVGLMLVLGIVAALPTLKKIGSLEPMEILKGQ